MGSRTSHRRVAAGAVLMASALLLTSCGSDEEASGSQGPDLSAPPQKLSWSKVKGVSLPVSSVHGPRDVGTYSDASGWEHSPQGAALAAVNGSIRPILADDKHWEEAAAAAFAPTEGRDLFTQARVSIIGQGMDKSLLPTAFNGYKFSDYSDEHAEVTVFTSYTDGSKASNEYAMDFTGGDWKIHLPDDGNAGGSVKAVDNFPDDMVPLEAK